MKTLGYQVHRDSPSLPLIPPQTAPTRRRSLDDYMQHGYHKPGMYHSSVEVFPGDTNRHVLGRPPSEPTPSFNGLVKVFGRWMSKHRSVDEEPLIPEDMTVGNHLRASFAKKYGKCMYILHYGSSCSVRLYRKRVSMSSRPSHPPLAHSSSPGPFFQSTAALCGQSVSPTLPLQRDRPPPAWYASMNRKHFYCQDSEKE